MKYIPRHLGGPSVIGALKHDLKKGHDKKEKEKVGKKKSEKNK